jgi:hypothetical protein
LGDDTIHGTIWSTLESTQWVPMLRTFKVMDLSATYGAKFYAVA